MQFFKMRKRVAVQFQFEVRMAITLCVGHDTNLAGESPESARQREVYSRTEACRRRYKRLCAEKCKSCNKGIEQAVIHCKSGQFERADTYPQAISGRNKSSDGTAQKA